MGYVLLYPILTINIESNNMNATQDASNDMQNDINKKLISFNESQNDLIFKTRERLFKLEHNHKINSILFTGLIAIIYIMTIALVVSHG